MEHVVNFLARMRTAGAAPSFNVVRLQCRMGNATHIFRETATRWHLGLYNPIPRKTDQFRIIIPDSLERYEYTSQRMYCRLTHLLNISS